MGIDDLNFWSTGLKQYLPQEPQICICWREEYHFQRNSLYFCCGNDFVMERFLGNLQMPSYREQRLSP